MYICGVRIWDPRTNPAVEAHVPSSGAWWGSNLDFKGKVGNSQVDKKEQRFGKQILSRLPRHRVGPTNTFSRFLSAKFSSCYAKVISLSGADFSDFFFFKQVRRR